MNTNRRNRLCDVMPFLLAGALALLSATVTNTARSAEKPAAPNIILILADDLGAECLRCYGGTSYQTPNLDALAQSGSRFTHAYCTPLCSPSRVQLMTGRYGFRTGWTQLISGPKESFDYRKEKTFGQVLQAAGYRTGIAGKWQLCDFDKHPNHVQESGFDEHRMWTWMYMAQQRSRYWDPFIWENGKLRADTKGKYGPDLFCDFAVDFIRRHQDKPFFFYYPMALVHDPFVPTPDSKMPAEKDPNLRFADMVAYMDKLVGRIVGTLDELKLRENTLILFTGDNGTPRQIISKRGDVVIPGGKGTMTEAGTHVPLIASWKGTTPAGKVVNDLIDFSDMLPTLCALTGAEPPQGVLLDGVSFAPQLRGQAGKPREWVFSQLGKQRCVRDLRWKLHGDGRLYDMDQDFFEKNDLAASQDAAAIAARKRLQPVLDQLKP